MRYEYWTPAPDLAQFLGSYYIIEIPEGGGDLVRAEVAHIRFILSGTSTLQHGHRRVPYGAPTALVCGPSLRTGSAHVSPGSKIIGASVTPLGWQMLLGLPMHEMSNQKVPLDAICRFDTALFTERIAAARSDTEMFGVVDGTFRDLLNTNRRFNEGFIGAASAWLLDPRSPGLDSFLAEIDLSHRQTDRLCRAYFGASPKRLHRLYRALHVSTQLAWTGETDWRQVAGDQYYDQAHFIKDFRDLIGCTPGEFVRGPNMMIRFDLMKRLSARHQSLFSLIG